MKVALYQDGRVVDIDVEALRVWHAERRVRADSQVYVGNGWVPVHTFLDGQKLVSRPQAGITVGVVMKAVGLGAAILVGLFMLGSLLDSNDKEKKATVGRPKRRLFLSFDYEDKSQVDGFRLLEYNKNVDLEFVDGSLRHAVKSENEAYIRKRIREQMRGTSVCVCLIGSQTYKSTWVDWEIRACKQLRKGLLGIHLKNQRGRVPRALTEFGATVIDWEPHKFAEAIENAAKEAGR